ncbi:hypothetical protein [Candidatus Nanohalobium constans]|uniref:Uncharacterized protein n=1 Tax=Candidatus Nanohalobium constans TaxID=2565781 RepID=A0A5Q0UGT6_9ARCH|nr:hypothetical protein [Candidatus Nanohalobium constans]QGA80827.1 hypothetical protein LC1Nh_0945 [Candidatus Nanohalobium constans]
MNGQVALAVAFIVALGLIATGYSINSGGIDIFEKGFLGDSGLLDSVNDTGEESIIQKPNLSNKNVEQGGQS